MKWKNRLIHAGVLLAVFCLAVVIFEHITNKQNQNMTTDMGTASRPQIAFSYHGYMLNDLPAYRKQMEIPAVRDTVTPVTDGALQLNLKSYENMIDQLSYTVYSLDGTEKLLEKSISQPGESVTLALDAENLLAQERVLEVVLHMDGDRQMHYYTRIREQEGTNALTCLDYIRNFHENALDKAEGSGIGTAIEPNEEGDNTTMQHVTIHSDYDHVTWGKLEPQVVGSERWNIKELNNSYIAVVLEYRVKAKGEENAEDEYKVREYFRVRYVSSASKMYLLGYDRTMDQVFDPSKKILNEKGVILGITDPDVAYKTNPEGTIAAFVQADELWNYNREKDELSLVFSFEDAENSDVRNSLRQHEIRILDVDKDGNTTFAVCGYMNRGVHEAETGMAVYYYNTEQNSVNEQIFVSNDKGYERTILETGQLVYYNVEEDLLYTLIGDTLYETDIRKRSTQELTGGLKEGQYVVSDDGHLVAYHMEDSERIQIKNVASGEEFTITAAEGEIVKPLGFIYHDFVCGTAKAADAGQTAAGEELLPMYKIEIRNPKNQVVKTYVQEGVFMESVSCEENMITLDRVTWDGTSYVETAKDYITNNEETQESNVSLETYVTELKEKQVRIAYGDGISDKEPKLLKPKQVIKERTLEVTFESSDDQFYYVYGNGKLQGAYTHAGEAILTADSYRGLVVDSRQRYIWERGNRDLKYSIDAADEQVQALRGQLAAGASPSDAIAAVYGAETMDLSGCSIEQVLYVVNQGRPVIAVLDAQNTILILGYGENTVTFMNAATGETAAVPYNQISAAGYFGVL